jgi:hypothetical protein
MTYVTKQFMALQHGVPCRLPLSAPQELAVPGYHALDARGKWCAWRAARPMAACTLYFCDAHAGSGEPGVRQAFERIDNERALQI